MAWKILTLLGFLSLAGAGAFSWFNKEQLEDARYLALQDTANKKQAEERQQELEKLQTSQTSALAELDDRLKTKQAEVVQLGNDKTAQEEELAKTVMLRDQVKAELTALEEKIKISGDISKLMAEVKQHQTDLETATNEVAALKTSLDSAKQQTFNLTNRLAASNEKEEQHKRAIVPGNFQAYVSRSYPQFGFIVINKGDNGGAYLNSVLDVLRGNAVVGRVKITHVESNSATANVVPGTMAPGDAPQRGDLLIAGEDARRIAAAVKAGHNPPTPGTPTTPGAPATDPAAPATPGAPVDPADPFGAPAGAPDASDPFATPPSTPAAPADGAADPFATPPSAPATETPAAPSADPFDTPAPAMDAAPAGN